MRYHVKERDLMRREEIAGGSLKARGAIQVERGRAISEGADQFQSADAYPTRSDRDSKSRESLLSSRSPRPGRGQSSLRPAARLRVTRKVAEVVSGSPGPRRPGFTHFAWSRPRSGPWPSGQACESLASTVDRPRPACGFSRLAWQAGRPGRRPGFTRLARRGHGGHVSLASLAPPRLGGSTRLRVALAAGPTVPRLGQGLGSTQARH